MKNVVGHAQQTHGNRIDGHTVIAQTLKKLGVTHIYGMSGSPIRETLPKINQKKINNETLFILLSFQSLTFFSFTTSQFFQVLEIWQ